MLLYPSRAVLDTTQSCNWRCRQAVLVHQQLRAIVTFLTTVQSNASGLFRRNRPPKPSEASYCRSPGKYITKVKGK